MMIVQYKKQSLSYANIRQMNFRPIFVLCIFIFFIIGTPFELYKSGFGYTIKLIGLVLLILFAYFFTHARILYVPTIPVILIIITLILNIVGEYSDRGLIAVAVMTFSLLLGLARSAQWDLDFTFLVRAYLSIHLAALGYVVMMFLVFGVVTDLHGTLFPHEGRVASYGSFSRLAGLHNEPGTYAQWILAALFLYIICSGQLLSWFSIVVATSTLFTFSVWAYGAYGVFLSAILAWIITSAHFGLRHFLFWGSRFVFLISILVTGVFLLPDHMIFEVVDFFKMKLSFQTVSGYSKLDTLDYFRANLHNFIFIGEPILPGLCPTCASPQDAGLGVNSIYYFGLLPVLFLFSHLGISIFRKWGFAFVVFSSIFLGWKALFYDPLLWIIIGRILSVPPNTTSSSREEVVSWR